MVGTKASVATDVRWARRYSSRRGSRIIWVLSAETATIEPPAACAVVLAFTGAPGCCSTRATTASGTPTSPGPRICGTTTQLTAEFGKALSGRLEPEQVEVVEGRAEVRKIIKVGRSVIAGSYVTDGRIVRSGSVRIWRGGKVVATDKIDSLRRFKDDVREVQTGFECGISLASVTDIEEGDILECYTTQTVSRSAVA